MSEWWVSPGMFCIGPVCNVYLPACLPANRRVERPIKEISRRNRIIGISGGRLISVQIMSESLSSRLLMHILSRWPSELYPRCPHKFAFLQLLSPSLNTFERVDMSYNSTTKLVTKKLGLYLHLAGGESTVLTTVV